MGLDPRMSSSGEWERVERETLDSCFNGGSPYFDMYKCGYYGVPFELCADKCRRNGIALRKKDVAAYNDGVFKKGVGTYVGNAQFSSHNVGISLDDMRLSDFPLLPAGWHGAERRFFPCTQDNKPMQKWGWTKNPDGSVFVPELYLRADAKALSPCGWVGQNMIYQRFIVVDIDGRGHGQDDLETIAFGSMFKDLTLTLEDPKKPGSFHLYFGTDRLIPVRHFPWAKIDFMGNAVNAAVYFKNKIGNDMPMLDLDQGIWDLIQGYQKERKEKIWH